MRDCAVDRPNGGCVTVRGELQVLHSSSFQKKEKRRMRLCERRQKRCRPGYCPTTTPPPRPDCALCVSPVTQRGGGDGWRDGGRKDEEKEKEGKKEKEKVEGQTCVIAMMPRVSGLFRVEHAQQKVNKTTTLPAQPLSSTSTPCPLCGHKVQEEGSLCSSPQIYAPPPPHSPVFGYYVLTPANPAVHHALCHYAAAMGGL
ncbi:hypothetical protein J4Q44_G00022580 [Coregonus suidteri]|uniref:Uncharacterized protein n=1 Tax=Coregonus suidteri TaxID=861788 RepID=A0AAN8R781_9TELE